MEWNYLITNHPTSSHMQFTKDVTSHYSHITNIKSLDEVHNFSSLLSSLNKVHYFPILLWSLNEVHLQYNLCRDTFQYINIEVYTISSWSHINQQSHDYLHARSINTQAYKGLIITCITIHLHHTILIIILNIHHS